MVRKDLPPIEGQQVIAWAGLVHAFGTVEIIERTTMFDRQGAPTWLAVCVDPFYAPYTGSLVVVRQARTGTVFVLAADNAGVLWNGSTPDGEAFDSESMAAPTRGFLAKVKSYKHGDTTIDVNAQGMIVNAAGEYGRYYIGMEFFHFVREFRKADKGMTYRRVRN